MKKFLIVTIAALSLFVVGCNKKEEKNKDTKKPEEIAMEKYAKDYYIRFMNKYLTNPTVSLESLRKSKSDGYTDYDFTQLDKCKDTSYTELQLEEGTNEVIGYKHHLECN